MGKRVLAILVALMLVFGIAENSFSQQKNPSREEVEKLIEEVATKRGIPSVILKCIAKLESGFRQFDSNGNPFVSKGGYIGIMQISEKETEYNLEKLKYDPVYNIEAGANHLLKKWAWVNNEMTQVGNMDPNILEHWYFTLWAYNGLLERNNPNVNSSTYQARIYETALKEYNQEITPISKKSMPSRGGRLHRNINIPTPEVYHEGDIIKYTPNDIVIPDTMEKADGKDPLVLYDGPKGNAIGTVKEDQTMTILEGPALKRGFYFYKVKVNEDKRIGWVYGNWIVKLMDNF
ncbi:transglycosylase SLT domain-containing protein [Tepidimicrobium xylanilyticum]|uniref:Transglycosylase SLT domain-containing protein n=1 Tax=Tepidimicrobium xylanilyticum TaxID=1123352 RepID=A0A1H2QXH4_9FIRM|nr:transglycosylase SLT domain-containing protein [Tepidimicrobium xylanilyticum]SDW11628.1 Transglycosylase SLT domain-containing protein [Tepidimicrobium xylanilyticum]